MTTLISKSTRTRYFQLSILIFLVTICVLVMLSYVNRMEKTLEQFRFQASLSNLKRIILFQELARNTGDTQCVILNDKDLFISAVWASPMLTSSSLFAHAHKPPWQYDPVRHQLTYQVQSVDYFWSPIGPRVEIDFLCNQGKITMQVSAHKWCQNWHLWGCVAE